MKDFTFNFIAKQCLQEFHQVAQWARHGSFEQAAKYKDRAEVLLELLEVKVCGSVGGFDVWKGESQQYTENPRYVRRGYTMDLFHRLLWIIDHYTTIKEKDKVYDSITVGELIKEFKKTKVR